MLLSNGNFDAYWPAMKSCPDGTHATALSARFSTVVDSFGGLAMQCNGGGGKHAQVLRF